MKHKRDTENQQETRTVNSMSSSPFITNQTYFEMSEDQPVKKAVGETNKV